MRNHPEVITVLNDLEQKGQLKELRRLRIIDSHTLYDAEVYWLVDAEMVQGHKKSTAITLVSEKLRVSENAIYKPLQRVKVSLTK